MGIKFKQRLTDLKLCIKSQNIFLLANHLIYITLKRGRQP